MASTENTQTTTEDKQIPSWRLTTDNAFVNDAVLTHRYPGEGTTDSPFIAEWLPGDPRNPLNWSMSRKAGITLVLALSSLSVSCSSTACLTPAAQMEAEFHVDNFVVTLGIFTFNLAEAAGPQIWAPLSELYGRQAAFLASYLGVTIFNGGCTATQSMVALLVCRFFVGFCASSPFTNVGGIIGDMFPPSQRGLAMAGFASPPYLGPAPGPIAAGFLSEKAGWRWVNGLMTFLTGSMLLLGALTIPETYAPFLLSQRAKRLTNMPGKLHRDAISHEKGDTPLMTLFRRAFGRPWLLLLREPIISLLTMYMALIFGTLYSFVSAFPIVYEEIRGWSVSLAGLAFLDVAVGMILGAAAAGFVNIQYRKLMARGQASPGKRLIPGMVGSIMLFWWAFTTCPSINAIVSIAAGVTFATGMEMIYLAVTNYLIDSYGVYAASALAANTVLRCIFGAIFPLFTSAQYHNLGIHWGAALMGFLALACAPFPWIFAKYGAAIGQRRKYSAEAERSKRRIAEKQRPNREG